MQCKTLFHPPLDYPPQQLDLVNYPEKKSFLWFTLCFEWQKWLWNNNNNNQQRKKKIRIIPVFCFLCHVENKTESFLLESWRDLSLGLVQAYFKITYTWKIPKITFFLSIGNPTCLKGHTCAPIFSWGRGSSKVKLLSNILNISLDVELICNLACTCTFVYF